ncbi:MAG: molybdopterin-binding protein [Sporomusaceae bacterium]|nr:molybdopterin-binding protein [Sporomusaceae bacterium]
MQGVGMMAIKKVRVEEAVGMVLGHDITKIVPGEYKGPAFKKGHIIRAEDISHLKDIGKEHIYLIELTAGQVHENEAVTRIARAVAGAGITLAEPSEGKVNLKAAADGLLKVNRELVTAINGVEHAVLSTLHSNLPVKAGDLLASVKVVPLVVEAATVETVEKIAAGANIVSVMPMRNLKVAAVITGNEVFHGRIDDRFAPVFAAKTAQYGATMLGATFRPDDPELIKEAILAYKDQGADVIVASGGMSVDPDDVTPDAIRATGAEVVSYGTPVLPGAMFMLAYLGDVAVMGMPACGMYSKTTVFDLILPRVLAGERLRKDDIAALGYGGLCLSCRECTHPHCPFGKA